MSAGGWGDASLLFSVFLMAKTLLGTSTHTPQIPDGIQAAGVNVTQSGGTGYYIQLANGYQNFAPPGVDAQQRLDLDAMRAASVAGLRRDSDGW